jgi:uncharacterized protein YoxC
MKALEGLVQAIFLMRALSRLLKDLMSLKRHVEALTGLVQAINKGLKHLTKALRGLAQAINGALFRPKK